MILSKAVQLAIDANPLFYYDSAAFLENAAGRDFVAYRSWVYSWLVGAVALPLQSLTAMVVFQAVVGVGCGWLLSYLLYRFLGVRFKIAAAVAVLFAWDPSQLVFERMVMTENVALLALVLMIWMYLRYLEMPEGGKGAGDLVLASAAGIVLVGLRISYLPSVISLAALVPFLPFMARAGFDGRRFAWRPLAVALAVSLVSTGIFQGGYQVFTGYLAGRKPAYHYDTGFFLLAAAAPLVEPQDADRADLAALVEQQQQDDIFPLGLAYLRNDQLWTDGGLVPRLRSRIQDPIEANQVAGDLARRAILRRPVGFLRLGAYLYREYWRRSLESEILASDHGEAAEPQLPDKERDFIRDVFHLDTEQHHRMETVARWYHRSTPVWNLFQLLAPFLCGLGAWVARGPARMGMVLLLILSMTILTSITLGGVAISFRYLHPFSWIGFMAVAVTAEAYLSRRQPADVS